MHSSPRVARAAGAATAPGTPTGITVTRGSGQAVVSWTAPAANGSPITGYTATAYTSNGGNTVAARCTASATTCTMTGLTNGTTYYVSVTATNAVGTSAASARTAVTPATVPTLSAVNVTAQNNGGTRQLRVSWTSNNGGTNVLTSTVRVWSAASGGTQVATCVVVGAGTNCTAPGLAQGTLTAATNYWVTVESTNAIGTSAVTNRVATRTL